MPRCLLIGLLALGLSACGAAENQVDPAVPWPDVLEQNGLAAAERHLSNQNRSADSDFVLGGVQFLRAFEAIMQVRYENAAQPMALLPGMRNALPGNPDATFDPAFLERAMTDALVHLERSEQSLASATGKSFAVDIPLTAIWFDINKNGTREDWESVLPIMEALNAEAGENFDGLVRFDSADAHWLKAYVHVMSGMAELTLATDPTPAIRTVYEGRQNLDRLGTPTSFFIDNDDLDTIAAVLLTLRGVPDKTRTQAAHKHFKAMIAENRKFWETVMLEGDDEREWLPNPNQTSVFGVEVTPEMAEGWQDVLSEIEAILDGEKLVPYWRFSNPYGATSGIGLNVSNFLQEPGDLDVILWVHGGAAAPFLERGNLAQMEAWDRFTRMTRGDSLLFAMWFN